MGTWLPNNPAWVRADVTVQTYTSPSLGIIDCLLRLFRDRFTDLRAPVQLTVPDARPYTPGRGPAGVPPA